MLRIKTVWFRKDGESHGAEETAGAIASIIWRLSDLAVTNLSKADFDIITPQRGFSIMAELISFMVHLTDRMLYDRVDEDQRTPMIHAQPRRQAGLVSGSAGSNAKSPGFAGTTGVQSLKIRCALKPRTRSRTPAGRASTWASVL